MQYSRKTIITKLPHNKVVWLLTMSDIFIWGSYFIMSSLAGLYLEDKIESDVVRVIGIGMGLYFITRALVQLPIGVITDRLKTDKDEIVILFISAFVMGLPYMLYPLVDSEYKYYFLQIIFGIGASMNLNTWRKLFAINVDKNQEGLEYGFYETLMSFSSAVLVTTGGIVANISKGYFDAVVVAVGIITMVGGMWGGLVYFVRGRNNR